MKNVKGVRVDWRSYPGTTCAPLSMICDGCKDRHPAKKVDMLSGREIWCFHCSGLTLCSNFECEKCEPRRLSNLERFSKNFVMNTVTDLRGNKVDPRMLTKGCMIKLCLQCLKCGDPVIAHPNKITNTSTTVLCVPCDKKRYKSGAAIIPFSQSCASEPFMVILWSPENKLTPEKVVLSANQKILFCCPDCKNKWKRSPRDITKRLGTGSNRSFCTCCTRVHKVCGRTKEECPKCWDRSFASRRAAKWFDYEKNYPTRPEQINLMASKLVWFLCPKFHSYRKRVSDTSVVPPCPECEFGNNRYVEGMFFKYLNKYYGEGSAIREFTIERCRGRKGGLARFDGLLFGKIIFEVDGRQHYLQDASHWDTTVEVMQEHDRYKDRCAMQAGFGVIRISQRDIKFDRNNWRENTHMLIDLLLKQDHHRHVFRCYEGKITWEEHVLELEF